MSSVNAPEKLLVFDFDGTIADTFQLAIDIARQGLIEFGYQSFGESEIPELREMSVTQLIRRFKINPIHLPKMARYARKKLKHNYHEVMPVKNMVRSIDSIRKEFTVGIVSSNDEALIRMFMKDFGLKRKVDFVKGGVGIFEKKRALKKVLKETNAKTSDCYYIGDEIRDIEAAKRVGINSISVTWGFNGSNILEKNNPDYIVNSPSELLKLINGLQLEN